MTEMYDPNNPAHVGPQVTARPGTKRHLKQVRARALFFTIQAAGASGRAKQAAAVYETAKAKTDELRAELVIMEQLFLIIAEPSGNA